MTTKTITPKYHVLLIGIDRYPPGYNSLAGCVNDIDAIERLLLEPPGIGLPAEQIRVTRLAARRSTQPAPPTQGQELAPTKANLVQALQALAGPEVKDTDRVLIYYSGHGDQKLWTGSSVWHEALIPHNDQKIEYLFDVEINALINAIAARTSDLTIVFDCCHSAGATRDLSDIQSKGVVRALAGDSTIPVAPPNLSMLGLGGAVETRAMCAHLLQTPDPSYIVVVACQSDEKAGEGAPSQGDRSHGVFTHSLLSVLDGRDATQRAELRWTDIWPALLARAAERNAQLSQRTQHPWMIGRSERKIFGGAWEKMDAGYRVTLQDGTYKVGAGSLMSVTTGAEIAVYGPEPHLFPAVGSPEDRPVGRLAVTKAGPSSAVASAIGAPFALLEGARGRLAKPGESQRLRVSLKPADNALQAQLQESPLLEIVSPTDADADVEVITQPNGTWIIGADEPLLARVPVGELQALRAGLEHLYAYNTVLRMARNCDNSELSNSLSVQLLDCNDEAAMNALSPEQKADPNLPEAHRDSDRIYALQSGFKFCVRVANSSSYDLNVTLLNCSAGGMVQYLSDALLRAGASHVMWLDNQLGVPFEAWPDELPSGVHGIPLLAHSTEQMIAIGTTRRDVVLRFLTLDKSVQQVVNENLSTRGEKSMRAAEKKSTAPVELWTATLTHVRIPRQ